MTIVIMSLMMEEDNRRKIINAYNSSENKVEDLSAERLILNIEQKLYTEFSLNNPHIECLDYSREAFTKWVGDETHYEMERQGFYWDGKIF